MQIGIDAGSKFLKIAYTDNKGIIVPYAYYQHFGNPAKEISSLLNNSKFYSIERIAFSGHHADQLSHIYENSETADEISAIIETLNYLNNKCRYIINVGAGSIKLIKLNEKGNFSSYTENSLCAAGTGSFLDEQMHRMNFTYTDIGSMSFIEDGPDIATRCAVFAKSDLIHRQQEGYSKEEMWSGLCRGVTSTMLQSVFRGDIPSEEILFCGGLFLNAIVREWIKKTVERPLFHDDGHFFPAIGSIILNGENKKARRSVFIFKNNNDEDRNVKILESRYSRPVDFSAKKEYFSNNLEVRLHSEPADDMRVSIGIDIGSTSTKLVVIDAGTFDVLIDIYGKTEGNPLEATGRLFNELKEIIGGRNYNILSTGTTGSGRKLVGKIIGADTIINEITSHFKGAAFFSPSIETIFEIGGQDSKYIRGQNGNVVDCNMNFVCAAGTGSFIEEQAVRLGFYVREIGDLVLGLKTPHTSDRCTVFMEQDINKLLREGYSREEVLAGVIRSISKNYLNRVVGPRPVTGQKIFFQGATARNKGLVAAFESLLNKEIIVSPYCHVMGAFGAAIISLKRNTSADSRFRGLDIFNRHIDLEYTQCKKCSNLCKITTAKFDNGFEESWGFMCGKDTFDEEKKARSEDHFRKLFFMSRLSKRSGALESISSTMPRTGNKESIKIGIPFVLSMLNYMPLWKTFLEDLGFRVILSDKSTPAIKKKGISISKADFCFPVKISLGHIQELANRNDIDYLFFPTMLSDKMQANKMPRMLCPYVISYPSVAKETLNLSGKLIFPTVDFRQKKDVIINELYKSLSSFNFSKHRISKAYSAGIKSLNDYLQTRYAYGQRLLNELEKTNNIGIVCVGRPYNLYDKIVNLGLTERLKNDGMVIFPYECMIDPDENNSPVEYMYWNYGERILSVAKKISGIENIYPVYFTNFSCGPDSFILSRFEEIMAGKPYLIIELDEHGSETGYLTRIEAFMDVVLEKNRKKRMTVKPVKIFQKSWKHNTKKIWFPPMFEIAPRFFAAAFRAWGFDAEALPVENDEAYESGRQNTRGSECLPACTTIGGFLKTLKEINADSSKHALFMPTAEGPCRFGQYSMLHRSILDKNGFTETEVFSPSSSNSYMGMTGSLRRYLLDVIMASDILSKFVYKIRPYEVNKGETDKTIEEIIIKMESAIEKKGYLPAFTETALARLLEIPVDNNQKPLVGIVGEIYVRSNPFCNNHVIRYIEENGGEAWLSPMSEWVIYTAWMERFFARNNRTGIFNRLGINLKTNYMIKRLHEFEDSLRKYIPGRTEPPMEKILEEGRKYVPIEFEGETILTIGRTINFFKQGADMVVNCAPFGCMPGNITTSIFHNIQRDYNRPVINLFYDGESDVNRIIGIYLSNTKKPARPDFPVMPNKQYFSLTKINKCGYK